MRPSLSLILAAAALLAGTVRTQEVPASVLFSVDTSDLGTLRRATASFSWTTNAPIEESLGVRLELRVDGTTVLRRDHSPPIPTTDWSTEEPTRYDLPLVFAIVPDIALEANALEVWIGFLDPRSGRVRSASMGRRERSGLARIGRFDFPFDESEPDQALVDSVIDQATNLAKEDPEAAWSMCESLLRRTEDYRLKADLRDALDEIGRFEPKALTFEEQQIVRGRINGEYRRYLRLIAGRHWDRGDLFAALVLLDEIGGTLAEEAGSAVLGALNEADRVTRDRDDLVERIYSMSDEQEQRFRALREEFEGDDDGLFDRARDLAKKPDGRAIARRIFGLLRSQARYREEATEAKEQLEESWIKDIPKDQIALADEARDHPAFARTTHVASHRFVFIGPKKLVEGIPDDSKRHFDLAYVYLTDLFGRVPNPGGDRVTVYYKELWDFGGGVGGGKIIDIGRANPDSKKTRVDNGLLYHELTHCIDDTNPIYPGFREGLADFGAAFALHELGQRGPARASIGAARRGFLQDYLERDLEYWRIPNYAPSAGFLLHFITEYGKREGGGYEWQRYRKFFRDFRDSPVKDARTPYVARSFAYHLVQAFGEEAFGDLIRFRWPLVRSDLESIALEQESPTKRADPTEFEDFEGSPVTRDLTAYEVARDPDPDSAEEELGILRHWRVIGPFRMDGSDPDAFRFPPEHEVIYEKDYVSGDNRPRWFVPGRKPVTVEDMGWHEFHFAYMDNTASYAVTHIRVERETDAYLYVRSDDEASLFLNDALVGKADTPGGPMGPWRIGWRTRLPDAVRFPITLLPGRNKVLLKVRNTRGPSGFAAAVTDRRGLPLEEWSSEAGAPDSAETTIPVPDTKRWKSELRLSFKKKSALRAFDVTVGDFKVRQQSMQGQDTDRGVAWRKYTVRPGFPKDSPSNLAWLKEKATEDLTDFELLLWITPNERAPKMLVQFQGEGRDDGLSGWTLILQPRGSKVRARLERYDRLVYLSDWVEATTEKTDAIPLRLTVYQNAVTATINEQMLFDRAPIRPIEGRHRIGIATWGPGVGIAQLELRAPRKTR